MAKITLDDILPISRYEEFVDSARKMAELTEEKFKLLISFLEENKESLLQKVDITKCIDDTLKIKAGMEEEYYKASFPESLKFCEEKKREYFEDKGIFLGSYSFGAERRESSFFRSESSHSYKENEIFYIPSVTSRDFLEVTKSHSSIYRGFAGHIHTTETVNYKSIDREDAMKGVNFLKLVKTLNEFLSPDNKESQDFSRFYNSYWLRGLK